MTTTTTIPSDMPFASRAQRAYLAIHDPKVAREFADNTTEAEEKQLPEHVKKKRKKKGKTK